MLFSRASAALVLSCLSSLCSVALFSANVSARPLPDKDPIGIYPSNTAILNVLDMHPQDIKAAFKTLPGDFSKDLRFISKRLYPALQDPALDSIFQEFSFIKGHFSMAYRLRPNDWGEILFQIQTSNENTLTQVLNQVSHANPKTQPQRLYLSDHTLYQIPLDISTRPNQPDLLSGLKLTLTQQGQFIRGSIGRDHRGLSEMLYLRQVHSPHSPWRLSSQKDVHIAQQTLSPNNEQWLYLRARPLEAGITPPMANPNISQLIKYKYPWIKKTLWSMQGTGISLQTDTANQHQVMIKHLTLKSRAAQQDDTVTDLLHLPPIHDFKELFSHFPAPLSAFLAGHITSDTSTPLNSNEQVFDHLFKLFQFSDTHSTQRLKDALAGPFAMALFSEPEVQNNPKHAGIIFDLKAEAPNINTLFQELKLPEVTLRSVETLPGGITAYELKAPETWVFENLAYNIWGIVHEERNFSQRIQPVLYFAQTTATTEHPDRLFLSNHLTGLKTMLFSPANTTVQSENPGVVSASQYLAYVHPSQFSDYLSKTFMANWPYQRVLTTAIESINVTQIQGIEKTTAWWHVQTPTTSEPWLKMLNTTPVPVSIMMQMVLPRVINAEERNHENLVISNMGTLQSVVEAYYEANQTYPKTLEQLLLSPYADAYKDLVNPYDPHQSVAMSLADYLSLTPPPAGVVIYEPLIFPNPENNGYNLYGSNAKGEPLSIAEQELLFLGTQFIAQPPHPELQKRIMH